MKPLLRLLTSGGGHVRARAVRARPDQRRVTMAVSPSHQTIKLSAGHHRRAEHGACVMELASMLTDGPFSDHPQSVCPVIAAFLRSYNDHVDDRRRQDLYRYAARVAGTRADDDAERQRSRMCLAWARACCSRPHWRVRILHRLLWYCQGPDVHAVYAARAAAETTGGHERALAFLDELIALPADPGSRPRRSDRPGDPSQPALADSTIASTTRRETNTLTLPAESAGAGYKHPS